MQVKYGTFLIKVTPKTLNINITTNQGFLHAMNVISLIALPTSRSPSSFKLFFQQISLS
jgi:hypothetical protein